MNCTTFEEWLDDGAPPTGREAALAHGADCPACAALLEATRSLERLLGQRFAAAPAGFADGVLARLPDRRVESLPLEVVSPPDLPWWSQMMMDPAVVASLVAAALVAGFAGTMMAGNSPLDLASRAGIEMLRAPGAALARVPHSPWIGPALAGFAAAVWGLYAAAQRLAQGSLPSR